MVIRVRANKPIFLNRPRWTCSSDSSTASKVCSMVVGSTPQYCLHWHTPYIFLGVALPGANAQDCLLNQGSLGLIPKFQFPNSQHSSYSALSVLNCSWKSHVYCQGISKRSCHCALLCSVYTVNLMVFFI